MIISNARIVLENKIIHGFIEFDNNRIINIKTGTTNKASYDAKGLYLLPAFIDSHTHGGYGMDFNMLANHWYKENLLNYFEHIHQEGVGSVLLTTVTCSTDDLNSIAGNYRNAKDLDKNNVIKGWYIEGPYISIKRKGAHNQKLIRPIDTNVLKKLKNLLPHVTKILAVAPEFKNNLSKYKIIKKDYFLATGHSDANYWEAMKSFDEGAKRVIHLYNALPNFDKRTPTILNAIFNRRDLKCELICDKGHVAPEVILNTYHILGADQIMVISDSLLTKGLKDGTYVVWGTEVDKRGVLDYIHSTDKISGGNLPYHKQIENFGNITKCSMNEILKVSSLNAAKSIKQERHFGNLVKDAESSFVLLDKKYRLITTFIKGVKI